MLKLLTVIINRLLYRNPIRHNNLLLYKSDLVLEIPEKLVKNSCLTAELFAGSGAFFGGSGVLSCNVCNGFKLLTYDNNISALLCAGFGNAFNKPVDLNGFFRNSFK